MSLMLLGILNSQAAGGAAGAYDLLETVSLTSNTTSVEFTGLGAYSEYKHLQIRLVARIERSIFSDNLFLTLNSNNSNIYPYHALRGDGFSVTSTFSSGAGTEFLINCLANSATANNYSTMVIDLLDFSSTLKNTTMRYLNGKSEYGADLIELGSGAFLDTSAITSIQIFRNTFGIMAGSRFSLYGVK